MSSAEGLLPSVWDVSAFFESLFAHPPVIAGVFLARVVVATVAGAAHAALQLPDVKKPQEDDLGFVMNLALASRPALKGEALASMLESRWLLIDIRTALLCVTRRRLRGQDAQVRGRPLPLPVCPGRRRGRARALVRVIAAPVRSVGASRPTEQAWTSGAVDPESRFDQRRSQCDLLSSCRDSSDPCCLGLLTAFPDISVFDAVYRRNRPACWERSSSALKLSVIAPLVSNAEQLWRWLQALA